MDWTTRGFLGEAPALTLTVVEGTPMATQAQRGRFELPPVPTMSRERNSRPAIVRGVDVRSVMRVFMVVPTALAGLERPGL